MDYTRTTATEGPIRNTGPYEAIIVNHLDPAMQGTLEVELLRYGSSSSIPERSGQLVVVKYLSPFYGVTPAKGINENDGFENTQKSYGFWAVPPDVGTRVLVIFAEGVTSYGYWIGCVQDNNMNMMVPGSTPSTTLTTEDTPVDLKDKKLPVGEYNKKLETGGAVDPNFFKKPYNKDFAEVLQVQGLLDDETRGTTTSSARRETPSMVFGMNTPGPLDRRKNHPKSKYGYDVGGIDIPFNRLGGSSFVMDDGDQRYLRVTHAEDGPPIYVNKVRKEEGGDETIPQNEAVRLRTRTGHQIVLHNSEDLIYIGNSRGTAWIELTSDGKIDIHAQDSISVMSDTDINFTAERDLNLEAGRNVNIKASARWSDGKSSEQGIESGRVQVESAFNTNTLVGGEQKTTVAQSVHLKSGADIVSHADQTINQTSGSHFYSKAGGSYHVNAEQSIYNTAGSNMYNSIAGSYLLTAGGSINLRAGIDMLANAVRNINWTAGTSIFSRTIIGDIHNTAKANIYNKTQDGAIHSIAETDIFNHSKTANINNIAEVSMFNQAKTADINSKAEGSIFSESTRNIEIKSGLGTHITSGAETHIQAGANFVSTGAEIHFNGPAATSASAATDASEGVDAKLPSNAAVALDANEASEPKLVKPLPLITLPYVFPGVKQPVPYQSIVPRAPQHEPWSHHENMNPLGFKRDQTDRENPGALQSADRFISPDAFLKGKVAAESSVRVVGSGGDITSDTLYDDDTSGTDYINADGDRLVVGYEDSQVDPALAAAAGYKEYKYGDDPKDGTRVKYVPGIENKKRPKALEPRMLDLLEKTAAECEVEVYITSAGHMPYSDWQKSAGKSKSGKNYFVNGHCVRTGSKRHDYGSAADLYIQKDGATIQLDTALYNKFVYTFGKLGGKGGGASRGYMGSEVMHLDIVGTDRGGGVCWLSSAQFKAALLKGIADQAAPIDSAFKDKF